MTSDIVKNWFGKSFSALAPELQALHLQGGVLQGKVEIVVGKGVAGFVGRRLAKKLNIPSPGVHSLVVNISHDDESLHWVRRFNNTVDMISTFKPVGTIDDGYWLEQTGPLALMLSVDIKDRGWYWRCLRFKLFGLPLPVWLFPKSKAYKTIVNGGYHFYVGFEAPLLGLLLSYSGVSEKH